MPPPLAYFITWTTYGTWLPGDPRSSVVEENRPGTPLSPPKPNLRKSSLDQLKHKPVRLESKSRQIVQDTIEEHCRHRSWSLHSLAIRPNHVHVVVSAQVPPEEVMTQLKSWCTRRLREAGRVGDDARVWTKHGSTRYLDSSESADAAIRYVRDGQGKALT